MPCQSAPLLTSGSVKWGRAEIGRREDEALQWDWEGFYRGRGKSKGTKAIFAMFFRENSGNNFIRE